MLRFIVPIFVAIAACVPSSPSINTFSQDVYIYKSSDGADLVFYRSDGTLHLSRWDSDLVEQGTNCGTEIQRCVIFNDIIIFEPHDQTEKLVISNISFSISETSPENYNVQARGNDCVDMCYEYSIGPQGLAWIKFYDKKYDDLAVLPRFVGTGPLLDV